MPVAQPVLATALLDSSTPDPEGILLSSGSLLGPSAGRTGSAGIGVVPSGGTLSQGGVQVGQSPSLLVPGRMLLMCVLREPPEGPAGSSRNLPSGSPVVNAAFLAGLASLPHFPHSLR